MLWPSLLEVMLSSLSNFWISPGRIWYIKSTTYFYLHTDPSFALCYSWRVKENNFKLYILTLAEKLDSKSKCILRRDLCYWSFVSHRYNELEKSVDETHTHTASGWYIINKSQDKWWTRSLSPFSPPCWLSIILDAFDKNINNNYSHLLFQKNKEFFF